MPEVPALKITSEEEAWEYLERALRGDLPEDIVRTVAFEGWPRLDIYLPNTPVQSSLSPTMMGALIELQRSLYRTHAAVTKGDKSARLTKADKERLEFRVKVEGGSSKLGIDLTQLAESWGVAALGRMTPEQTMIAILATVVAVAGVTGLALFLKHRTEIRKAELDLKGQEQFFDAFKNLTEQDTKRQELWLAAQQQVPLLQQIREESNDAKTEILKAIADEGGGRVNGLYIDQDVANDLVAVTRRTPAEENRRGLYRVDKVDTTTPDGFRVTLSNAKKKEVITATLMDALISDEHRKRIREAEWSKRPVGIELRLRTSRGRILEATIVDVDEADAA